jgi:GT2 family glycosyltransferase
MDLVSVIIPNWNGERFIKECLLSVYGQTYSPLEVILIDNGSTDKSLDIVREDFPEVVLLKNQTNLGFSKAVNQGIEKAKGKFILLLNNDVTLQPEFVSVTVKAISSADDVGSVSGKLLIPADGGADVIDSTGHLIFRNRLAIDRGDGEKDLGQYDSAEEVFGACAAASLYRRAMLDDVAVNGEYFDLSFFAFLEDVDLNWRAQLRGWK